MTYQDGKYQTETEGLHGLSIQFSLTREVFAWMINKVIDAFGSHVCNRIKLS